MCLRDHVYQFSASARVLVMTRVLCVVWNCYVPQRGLWGKPLQEAGLNLIAWKNGWINGCCIELSEEIVLARGCNYFRNCCPHTVRSRLMISSTALQKFGKWEWFVLVTQYVNTYKRWTTVFVPVYEHSGGIDLLTATPLLQVTICPLPVLVGIVFLLDLTGSMMSGGNVYILYVSYG